METFARSSEKNLSLYEASRNDFQHFLSDQPPYRIQQIWDGLYQQGKPVEEITSLSKNLRSVITQQFPLALTCKKQSVSNPDEPDKQTVKWLWQLSDNHYIETVLMHYPKRVTVCVSTQAGCAMACQFCATGQMGFERHCTTGEIVEQVLHAIQKAKPLRVDNIVFMGMGEPFANFDQVWKAVERLHDDVGISARHLTLSTVGIIPGIKRLADENLPVNLAVSLHAANNTLRNELVPINKRYPLEELAKACEYYRSKKNRRLSFEWAMIDHYNDSQKDAKELAAYAKPLGAHVNLIPLNRTPGFRFQGSTTTTIHAFASFLERQGVTTTIRQNRGTDIDAACGQLRAAQNGQEILITKKEAPHE